jgi:putative alpha-1,2-mannosidase
MGYNEFWWDAINNRLVGYTTDYSNGDAQNFRTYIVVQFEGDTVNTGDTWISLNHHKESGISVKGEQIAIHLGLKKRYIYMKMAISYISYEQALVNLKQDMLDGGFAAARMAAEAQWEKQLSRIQIETETEEEMRTFYSCMQKSP